ncbi:hypothetical protein [Streptomyces solaniscabiei]|uniref:hypothetical protein n=1 Tax=Streptomyces solaniscabiei TaxID=2683255 RepID=UPI001CE2ADDC|nr:hypothetical protein [Streptomyces solaniscabiei]
MQQLRGAQGVGGHDNCPSGDGFFLAADQRAGSADWSRPPRKRRIRRPDGAHTWSGTDVILGRAAHDPRVEIADRCLGLRIVLDVGTATGVTVRDPGAPLCERCCGLRWPA